MNKENFDLFPPITEEQRMIQQIEHAWLGYNSKKRLQLPQEIYASVQKKFRDITTKKLIQNFPKIVLTPNDHKKLEHVARQYKPKNQETHILLAQIILQQQEIKKEIEYKSQLMQEVQNKEKEIILLKKQLKNKRKKAAQKKRKQLAKNQQPTLQNTPSQSTTKITQTIPTPQQTALQQILAAKRLLIKQHKVQTEAQLKNKLLLHCEKEDSYGTYGRISESCTWEYDATTNKLEIFTDDYSSSENECCYTNSEEEEESI
jgi:hypothetical protein